MAGPFTQEVGVLWAVSQTGAAQQAALCQVVDKGAQTELPGRSRLAVRDAVVQAAQPCTLDGDHIATACA